MQSTTEDTEDTEDMEAARLSPHGLRRVLSQELEARS
jgi:hypothetical protein